MAVIVGLLLFPSAVLGADASPAGGRWGWEDLLGTLLAAAALPSLVVLWMADVIRPGSLARHGVRDVTAWPWWFWLLCALVVVFAQQAGAGLGVMMVARPGTLTPGHDLTIPEQAMAAAMGGLAGAASGLLLMKLIARRTGFGPEVHGIGMPRRGHGAWVGRGVGLGLIGIALTYPVVEVVGLFSQWVSLQVRGKAPDPIAHETLKTLGEHRTYGWAWLLAASAVVLAPVVEELLFRVYLQSAILRLTRRAWPAILLTSVLFAGIHLGGGVRLVNAHTLLPLFVLGAAMGVAYERTRNVVVPITMHAAFNAVNVALTAVG